MAKEFSWQSVRVNILGRTILGIKGVSYNRKTEKTALYGRGAKPLALQSGNKQFEGAITLLQSEVNAMVDAVKAANALQDLTDVAFDIVVSYGEGNTAKTDVLIGCEIEEYEKGMEQNDPNMEIELKFKYLDLQENV